MNEKKFKRTRRARATNIKNVVKRMLAAFPAWNVQNTQAESWTWDWDQIETSKEEKQRQKEKRSKSLVRMKTHNGILSLSEGRMESMMLKPNADTVVSVLHHKILAATQNRNNNKVVKYRKHVVQSEKRRPPDAFCTHEQSSICLFLNQVISTPPLFNAPHQPLLLPSYAPKYLSLRTYINILIYLQATSFSCPASWRTTAAPLLKWRSSTLSFISRTATFFRRMKGLGRKLSCSTRRIKLCSLSSKRSRSSRISPNLPTPPLPPPPR